MAHFFTKKYLKCGFVYLAEGKYAQRWGSGVAQLVERLPPTPEVRGSNPVISKICM